MMTTLEIAGQMFGMLSQEKGDAVIAVVGPMRVWRGDTLDLVLSVTDDADEPVNLTGATIVLTVKPNPGDADATFQLAVGTGITLRAQAGDTLGQADIAITSAHSNKAPGLYYLDVVVVLASKTQHVIEPVEFTIGATVNP
jgi:uncharacterized protein YfaS (alpha-2-macroglobulin family)